MPTQPHFAVVEPPENSTFWSETVVMLVACCCIAIAYLGGIGEPKTKRRLNKWTGEWV